MENPSVVLYGAGDLRIEERPLPAVKPRDVLLEISTVGICGSDVHFYKAGRIGDYIVEKPMVCGHEASGIVVQTGKDVTSLKTGDRVAVEPGVPCRVCQRCKQGVYNLCPDIQFCAAPPVHGTMARYFAHPADLCYKLPDHVTMEEGALVEPLAVAVHACTKARVGVGSKVLITGAGPIGIVTLWVAQAMGASSVVMTDVLERRVAGAKEMGAQYAVLVGDDVQVAAQTILTLLGDAPDITVDCSGHQSAFNLALHATKPAGTIVQVGLGDCSDVTVSLIQSLFKEIQIRGSFRYANAYPKALALLEAGKVRLGRLVTHRYKIQDAVSAFESAASGQGLKVMVEC